MALKPCKECKQEVSATANTCPHCGVKNPGVTGKDMLLGVVGLCAVVAVIATSCGGDKKDDAKATAPALATSAQTTEAPPSPPAEPVASKPAESKAVTAKNLGMTPEEFRKSYNSYMAQMNKSWQVGKFKVESGAVNDTFTTQLGKVTGIVGTVDKSNGKVKELMLLVSSGTSEDNMQAIVMLLSAAHASTQGASKEEVSKVVSDLTTQALKNVNSSSPQSQSAKVGNREYTVNASQITGLMFAISDAQ